MTDAPKPELLPCPFCGAGQSEFRENGRTWMGGRYSEPTSVSVMHWCEEVPGQPSRVIQRVGRDRESAVAAWNLRAPRPEITDAERQLDTAASHSWERFQNAIDAARYRVIRAIADVTFDYPLWITTASGHRIHVTSAARSELDRMADAAILEERSRNG